MAFAISIHGRGNAANKRSAYEVPAVLILYLL
jgi:hypothetical protein